MLTVFSSAQLQVPTRAPSDRSQAHKGRVVGLSLGREADSQVSETAGGNGPTSLHSKQDGGRPPL